MLELIVDTSELVIAAKSVYMKDNAAAYTGISCSVKYD